MRDGYLLTLFLPDRNRPGSLRSALAKHPVQAVEGSAEPSVRDRYADRRGLLLTVVDWSPAKIEHPSRGAERVTLPEAVHDLLDEIAAITAPGGFELAVVTPDAPLRHRAQVPFERLRGSLALGCQYEVQP
ncbi:MAG: hypothetical protein KC620_06130 [Myxococcales bacterium]|nr:hypothetical protein [Myxococcales bacterium]